MLVSAVVGPFLECDLESRALSGFKLPVLLCRVNMKDEEDDKDGCWLRIVYS